MGVGGPGAEGAAWKRAMVSGVRRACCGEIAKVGIINHEIGQERIGRGAGGLRGPRGLARAAATLALRHGDARWRPLGARLLARVAHQRQRKSAPSSTACWMS